MDGTNTTPGGAVDVTFEGMGVATPTFSMESGQSLTTFDAAELETAISARIVLTVTSESYDNTGSLGTTERTIYGTKVIRKPYPDDADPQVSASGSDAVVRFALSDPIFNDDTAIVNISSGLFYDGTNTSNASSVDMAVTNSSTLDYPDVISNWTYPDYRAVTNTSGMDLKCVAFHWAGIACVKFTVTDEAAHSVSKTITSPTLASNNAIEYVASYTSTDFASFDDSDVLTCNYIAYPNIGDADSIADTANDGNTDYAHRPYYNYLDKSDARQKLYATVDSASGSDTIRDAYTSQGAADAAPFETIAYAIASIAEYHQSNTETTNSEGGIIYVKYGTDGTYNDLYQFNNNSATAERWRMVIAKHPDETQEVVILGTADGSSSKIHTQRVKISGITLRRTASQNLIGGRNTSFDVWIDDCTIEYTGAGITATQIYQSDVASQCYITDSTIDSVTLNEGTASNQYLTLVRGCTFTDTGRLLYCRTSIGNVFNVYASEASGFLTDVGAGVGKRLNNMIFAFNKVYSLPVAGLTIGNVEALTNVAIIQNLFESINSGSQMVFGTAFDDSEVDVTNVLIAHNSIIGQKANILYQDSNTAVHYRTNCYLLNNVISDFNIKTDTFDNPVDGASGARTGNWWTLYSVGCHGNVYIEDRGLGAGGAFLQDYIGYDNQAGVSDELAIHFTDDNSNTGSGTGVGNYTPLSSSVAKEYCTPMFDYDLSGRSRTTPSASGAFEVIGGNPYYYHKIIERKKKMSFKPVDTNITVTVGPLIDDTDFKSLEESIAYNASGMDIIAIIEKTDGTTTATSITPTSGGLHDWTHKGNGYYELEIPGGSGDYNNTEEGELTVTGICDGVLSFSSPTYSIVPVAVYNAIVKGTGNLTTELANSTITSSKFDLSTAYPVGAGINFQTLYNNISTVISKLPTAYIMGSDDQNSHDTDIDAILEDTGTTLPATLASILEDTGTTLPATLASILEDTGTTLPASLTTILGDTNELQTDWANGGRLDLLVDWIINVLEGDETIDTTTTPWQKVVKIKSTDTELIKKDLKDTAGSNVTSTSSVVGQSTEPA